jgi:hypothetical protein
MVEKVEQWGSTGKAQDEGKATVGERSWEHILGFCINKNCL